MSTVADYQDRRLDVLAFPGAKAAGVAQLSQNLLLEGGWVCVGVQKLAQRWMLEFLTIRGTMKYAPERGTDFLAALRAGSLRTESDVQSAFLTARLQAAKNMRADDVSVTDPDDETYADAELLSVAIRPDRTLVLTVEITSLAGTSRKVILPLTVGPGGV